jgi:hypothetical protein
MNVDPIHLSIAALKLALLSGDSSRTDRTGAVVVDFRFGHGSESADSGTLSLSCQHSGWTVTINAL